MPNVLVRDVAPNILDKLKKRAAKKGRSLQAEVRTILSDAAGQVEPLGELETARRIRASLSRQTHTDSAELLREDRGR